MPAPYALIRPLASGGMAELWLARRADAAPTSEPVVLKRIHPHLARKPGFRAMFLDEARIAEALQHPNLVRVFDHGAGESGEYIVMELLQGRDLRQVLNRCLALGTKLPPAFALATVRGAALGLAHAHAQRDARGAPRKIVHRDVSPENLFLTFAGTAKVLDFGVAAGASRLHETESGVLKGKLDYMSPEQIAGEEVDHRSDQFSLGVVLYELLARAPLFARRTAAETLRAIERCEVPGFPFPVSLELESALRRCLAKDRAQRFSSCSELAAALVLAPEFDWRPGAQAQLSAWMRDLFPEPFAPADAPRARSTLNERLRTAGSIFRPRAYRRVGSSAPAAPTRRGLA
jgi:eukaryotic-like serine/threonine-protein kinase